MERRFALRFDPLTEIVPLIGSKEGIAHLALGYLERGDVAVIPEPGYLAYLGGSLLAEATPHLVRAASAERASSSSSTSCRVTSCAARAWCT